MLARILPDAEVSDVAMTEMAGSISARSGLSPPEIELLLSMALAPENRMAINEDDFRAFGSRFGHAEEEALRGAVAEELDLRAFSERYGAAEGLLLLDALFGVCAVDGVIDRQEIGRLTRAATQLGIDAMLIGALFRKHDVRHATGDFTFELVKDRYSIGRDNACDILLPDPQVALRHADLIRVGDGWRVVDLGSGRPTLMNGDPCSSAAFESHDQMRVGSYTLQLDPEGRTLTAFGINSFFSLSVRRLERRIGDVSLLDDLSFTVFSGEVIAVVGPSGAGKTTLLNAIAGIAPADSGDVILDGDNFHALLANDRSIVGIVPQDDVVHPELTVEESLFYSGKLRFPSDTAHGIIQDEVNRVLEELDINHIRRSRIGDAVRRGVSGGQRKRVNLGQEMLTRTTRILFLDEPTSGLDPQTAQDIVSLIRRLADQGRIVFLVTHDVTPSIMSMVDHLMVLAPGGRLAWFGPPADACTWFDVSSPDEIFARLPDKTPPEWGASYRDGAASRKFVRTREHLLGLDGVEVQSVESGQVASQSPVRQYVTLTKRYARVKTRDTGGLAVLLAQAPILGVAMYIVFPAPDVGALFMLALSALWFGASASVRELISERTIWRREARVGLSTTAYLASKATVLGIIVGFQCLCLSLINYYMMGMGLDPYNFSLLQLSGITFLMGAIGLSLGLLMSSLFSSSEAAVGTLPLILIPQITFGGLLVKVKHMGALAKGLSYLVFVRYGFEALIKTGDELSEVSTAGGGSDRVDRGTQAVLYILGFKQSASVDDVGFPMEQLVGILLGCVFLLFASTWIFTHRSREGN
ncbi:MAG: ATP-binding cassette domain-containing protein [Rhodobacterales bacterium]|nr:ATP-binding cassette domain-containing protein [Rhodobacterales bacterium]